MSDRIWYDKRTKKYGASVLVQDGTEQLGEHSTEGEAQLAWVQATWWINHLMPSEQRIPPTENLESPNPLAHFSQEALMLELNRREETRDE